MASQADAKERQSMRHINIIVPKRLRKRINLIEVDGDGISDARTYLLLTDDSVVLLTGPAKGNKASQAEQLRIQRELLGNAGVEQRWAILTA